MSPAILQTHCKLYCLDELLSLMSPSLQKAAFIYFSVQAWRLFSSHPEAIRFALCKSYCYNRNPLVGSES